MKQLNKVAQDAELAFWQVVANSYPTATEGHLDPLMSAYLSDIMEKAISQWVNSNVPK